MESFIKENNPLTGWKVQQQKEFDKLFRKCLSDSSWDELEAVAQASRDPLWRPPLRDEALTAVLEEWLWPDTPDADLKEATLRKRSQFAIRLAANCCAEDEEFGSQHKVIEYLPRIKRCLNDKALFGITVGLLNNILTGDEVPNTLVNPILEEYCLQKIVAENMHMGWISSSDRLYPTGINLLEILAEKDIGIKVPAPVASAAAVTSLVTWIIERSKLLPLPAGLEGIVEAIIHWTSSDRIIKSLRDAGQVAGREDPIFDLIKVYKRSLTLEFEADEEEEEEEEEDRQARDPLLLFQNNISEMVTTGLANQMALDAASTGTGSERILKQMSKYVRPKDINNLSQLRLAALGFKVLVNIIQSDALAVSAVHKYALHEAAIIILESLPTTHQQVRNPAVTLLANLAISKANKDAIVESNAVGRLYTEDDPKNGLALHVLRKLTSNSPELSRRVWQLDGAEHGVLWIGDLVIPDQEGLFEEYEALKLGKSDALPQGPGSDRQITIDMGRLLVSMLRAVHSGDADEVTIMRSRNLTPEHIRCLCNLIRLGYLYGSNIQDASEGLFGLALALKSPNVDQFVVDALSWDNFQPIKTAIARGSDAQWQKAVQDKENALFLLAKLRLDIYKKEDLEEILREGTKMKSIQVLEEESGQVDELLSRFEQV